MVTMMDMYAEEMSSVTRALGMGEEEEEEEGTREAVSSAAAWSSGGGRLSWGRVGVEVGRRRLREGDEARRQHAGAAARLAMSSGGSDLILDS